MPVIVFTEEPVVGIGLRAMLAAGCEFKLARVCTQPDELLEAVAATRPGLVLYTLEPDPDLQILQQVRHTHPGCQIVVLSRELTPELAYQAMDLGVKGLLSTTASPEAVHECLRSARCGQMWLDPSLSVDLISTRTVNLSRRQNELVGLLVQGLKNKEIATAMGISEGTVKAYLTTLFEKVGAKDRFELALFGLKNLKSIRAAAAHSGRVRETRATHINRRLEIRRTVA